MNTSNFFQKILVKIQSTIRQRAQGLRDGKDSAESIFSVTTLIGTVTLGSFAVPMFIETVMLNLINILNNVILSGYSETVVAAVGVVGTLMTTLNLISSAVAMGAAIVVGNYIGADNLKKSQEASFIAVLACFLFGIVCSAVLLVFSNNIFRLMNLSGVVFDEAIIYFRAVLAILGISTASFALCTIMQCYGYPKYTVVISMANGIFNILFNCYVVYFENYSPFKGIEGIAAAMVLCCLVRFTITLFFLEN